MKDTSKMDKKMEKAHILQIMELNMKELMSKALEMDMEPYLTEMIQLLIKDK